jgi:hypothetical protein
MVTKMMVNVTYTIFFFIYNVLFAWVHFTEGNKIFQVYVIQKKICNVLAWIISDNSNL